MGALTLLTAILVIVPVVFGNLKGGTGEVVGSVAQVFGRTLLYSLLFAGLAAVRGSCRDQPLCVPEDRGPVVVHAECDPPHRFRALRERVPVRQSDELGELGELQRYGEGIGVRPRGGGWM